MSLARVLLAAAIASAAGCAPRAQTKLTAPAVALQQEPAPRLGLEQRLPADTHLFIRLDPAMLLQQIGATLRFVDPELGEQAASQAERARQSLVRMVANRGFAPRLAHTLFTTPIYLVGRLLDLDEGPPARTGQPQSAPQMGMALVLDCGSDLAADFLVHLEAELERGEEQSERADQMAWSQIEVDSGELIRVGHGELFFGRVEGFLVVAVLDPGWLWQAIGQPAPASLADTERYGRFGLGDPSWFGWIDLRTVVAAAERQAQRDHEDSLRRADAIQGPEGRRLRSSAETARQAYLQARRLLSLDRLNAIGARLTFQVDSGSLRYGLVAALAFDEPLSRTTDLILDAGRPFRLPAGQADSGLAVMWRFGLAGIYSELVGQLPENERLQVQIMDSSVQSATGYSIPDLLKLLAGDVYLLLDVLDAAPGADGEARSDELRTLYLMGITDLQATQRALSAVYEALTQLEGVSAWLSRREYLGRDVYLLGPPGAQGERDPAQSMAIALLTDHLALGDWNRVTERIRDSQAAPGSRAGRLAGLVERYRDASLLVVVTHELIRRLERVLAEQEDEPKIDELISGLQSLQITAQDDPAERELRDALVRLLQIGRELSQRQAGLEQGGLLIHGQRHGPLYELEAEATLERR